MLNQIKTHLNQLRLFSEASKIQIIIESIIQEISESPIHGKTLIVSGHTGSAADTLHTYSELERKFKKDRQALNFVFLNANPIIACAWANDFEHKTINKIN